MRLAGASVLVLATAGGAFAQVAAPVPTPKVIPVAAPDEVIVFEKPRYQGSWMRVKVGDELPDLKQTPDGNWDMMISSLKVGDDAVVVLYSSINFRRWCLGLPGKSLGGSGYYPDLARITNDDLRKDLGNKVRSLRVLGKDTDLNSVCLPVTPKQKSTRPRH